MGSIKRKCTLCPLHNPEHRLRSTYAAWEVHPSWKIAMESLDTYSHWVSEIVVPIAFQWIQDHKAEVYESDFFKQHPELTEDVGVVLSVAFDIVRQQPNYKDGIEMSKQIQREQQGGDLDTSKFNPVWTAIARQVSQEVQATFAKYKDVLKNSGE